MNNNGKEKFFRDSLKYEEMLMIKVIEHNAEFVQEILPKLNA